MPEPDAFPWPVRALGAALAACLAPIVIAAWLAFALFRAFADICRVAGRMIESLVDSLDRGMR